ncbi:MAG: hypothetical protein FJZ59_02355 [Chlamydiae bacterium]|nr:hypothetical protein [Chlamydiota bacterium]
MSFKTDSLTTVMVDWSISAIDLVNDLEQAVDKSKTSRSRESKDQEAVQEFRNAAMEFHALVTSDERSLLLKSDDLDKVVARVKELADAVFARESVRVRDEEEKFLDSRTFLERCKERTSALFSREKRPPKPPHPFDACVEKHRLAHKKVVSAGVRNDLGEHFRLLRQREPEKMSFPDEALISRGVKDVMRRNGELQANLLGEEYPVYAALTAIVTDCADKLD